MPWWPIQFFEDFGAVKGEHTQLSDTGYLWLWARRRTVDSRLGPDGYTYESTGLLDPIDQAQALFRSVGLLHIKVRLPVLLCAIKTVEGDFRFCWTISPNVGQTHKENPNLVRILYMVYTLNDIYKQYNKLHEHWYTQISSLRCVEDRNPPQNASDLYMKYWSYAEHCRPCGVNWWKKKKKKKKKKN